VLIVSLNIGANIEIDQFI